MPAGRPTDYTNEVADEICERLADGESLRAICDSESLPDKATVFRWLRTHTEFRDQYARARETQAETFYDELLAIADDGKNDWMEKHFGDDVAWVENGEALRRSALRIDTRKWAMSKMLPKRYGEKLDLNHSGSVGVTLVNDIPRPARD